ncbi:MAG TPA: hypothetical protein VE990_19175 [Acidimicrobiales bacterium]|nr:hypothetical protein [Acidimicrobiales bacterium]
MSWRRSGKHESETGDVVVAKKWGKRQLAIAGLASILVAAPAVLPGLSGSAAFAASCTDTWIGGSGDFGTAADWSTGAVPTSTDDACINATTGTIPPAAADSYTVTIDNAFYSVHSLTLGGPSGHQTLAIASLNVGLSIAVGSIINANGEMDLGDGIYGGYAYLSGGAGVTLTNDGTLLTNSADPEVMVNIDNMTGGTVHVIGSTKVPDGTTFTNDGGALTIDSGHNFHLSGGSSFANTAGTITNNGELEVSQGTFTQRGGTETGNYVTMGGGPGSVLDDDTTAGAANFYFTNETGYSTLTGSGTSPGVASGQTIVIQNNNMELDLGKNLTNAGTLDVSDSSVGGYGNLGPSGDTLTNTGSINTGAQAGLPVNVVNDTGGSVEISGSTAMNADTNFTNDGGALTIGSGYNFHLSGGSSFTNTAGTITNNGELEVSQGTFTQRGGTETGHYVTMGGGPGSVLDDDTTAGAANFYFTNETGYSTLTGTGASPGVASGQTIVIQNNNMELDLGSDIADYGAILVSDGSVGGYGNLNNSSHALTVEPAGSVTVGGGGDYIQGASGTLGVTIDAVHGTNTGITGGAGRADLAGTLQVTTLGTPALGSHWTVVNAGTVSGTFLTPVGGSVNYSVTYPPGQVVLTTPGISSTTTEPSSTTGSVTALSGAGVPTGTIMYDSATVSGNSASQSPSGSVSFYICSPSTLAANSATTCSSSIGTLFDTETLPAGSGGPVSVFSIGQTVNSAGTWCFAGYYGGDGTFGASFDTSSAECFTVTSRHTAPVSQITPTETTCNQFSTDSATTLTQIQYALKSGKISQVNPGVFFYWVTVTAGAGTQSLTITESNGSSSRPFLISSGSNAFNSSCGTVSGTKITQSSATGTVTVKFNAGTGGTFYIGIKFSTSHVVGEPAPSPSPVDYTFITTGVTGSTSDIYLVKK